LWLQKIDAVRRIASALDSAATPANGYKVRARHICARPEGIRGGGASEWVRKMRLRASLWAAGQRLCGVL
jgi:hypothetical protein